MVAPEQLTFRGLGAAAAWVKQLPALVSTESGFGAAAAAADSRAPSLSPPFTWLPVAFNAPGTCTVHSFNKVIQKNK